jgi:hypothetical protein
VAIILGMDQKRLEEKLQDFGYEVRERFWTGTEPEHPGPEQGYWTVTVAPVNCTGVEFLNSELKQSARNKDLVQALQELLSWVDAKRTTSKL